MGRAKVKLQEKSAVFSERSYDYDIGIDRDHIEILKKQFSDWKVEVLDF